MKVQLHSFKSFRRFQLLAVVLMGGILFSSCNSVKEIFIPPPSRSYIAVIFSDVTGSLSSGEKKNVSDLTVKLIQGLPVGTKYVVYPIHSNTEFPSPLIEGELGNSVQGQAKKIEVNNLSSLLGKLNKDVDTLNGSDQKSCILNTIRTARNEFKNRCSSQKSCVSELFYVSDMIEECNRTPLNRPVNLNKSDITSELAEANNFPEEEKLSDITVTIILPINSQEVHSSTRPNRKDFEEYWRRIFVRNGLEKPRFFNGTIPQKL